MEQRVSIGVKKEAAVKKQNYDDKVAKAMEALNRRKQQEKEDEEFYQMLSKPRSKKYVSLVMKQQQLAARLGELKASERAAHQEAGQFVEQETPEDVKETRREITEEIPEKPETASEPEKPKAWWETSEETSAKPEAATTQEKPKEWWETSSVQDTREKWWDIKEDTLVKEPAVTYDEDKINEEIAQIERELEELAREIEEEFPMSTRQLGVIYWSHKQDRLINMGVISAPGTPYFSLEDLYGQVQPRSEQEKKQWAKGDSVIHEDISDSLLIVEIYLTAVCAVNDDGSVRCYRD